MSRKSARPHYDAIVDLFPPRGFPTHAYAMIKLTYSLAGGRATLIEPEPLHHDLRDPELSPRWPPGSDFWPFKARTDVIVLGSAYPPGGRPAPHSTVTVGVGNVGKRIDVWGKRVIEWRDARPRIGVAESFESMPVTIQNAYGGADCRVPVKDGPLTVGDHERLQADHPGMYPRNPLGKGYVVLPDPVDGIELPNLEDPDDRLTDDRLIVGDPREWWKQPLPWSLDWTHTLMWPRITCLGVDAWFPSPDDAPLQEVHRGYVSMDWRQSMKQAHPNRAIPSEYYQEGSLGLTFETLAPGTPIAIGGMHPEGQTVSFALPGPPQIVIALEGRQHPSPARLTNVVIEPELERLTLTYAATTENLHRVFIPGVHGKIPLSVRVEGDQPVEYETPVPVREQVAKAKAEGKGGKPNVPGGS